MARVHLLTVHPKTDTKASSWYVCLKENALADPFKIHRLVADPDEADLIIFVEIDAGRLCESVLKHPYIKRFREKCYMFSTDWRVIPFIPGIYTAVEKSWYLPSRTHGTYKRFSPKSSAGAALGRSYSYRNASMGSSRDAKTAGQ